VSVNPGCSKWNYSVYYPVNVEFEWNQLFYPRIMLEEIRTKVLLGCNNLILYMYYYISCEYGGRIRRHDSANSRPSRALIMSSLRFLSVVRQATTSFALARRGYAEVSDKLKLSLVLPHKVGTQISFTAAMG